MRDVEISSFLADFPSKVMLVHYEPILTSSEFPLWSFQLLRTVISISEAQRSLYLDRVVQQNDLAGNCTVTCFFRENNVIVELLRAVL